MLILLLIAIFASEILLLELHITELCINEVGLSQASDIFPALTNQRFECLWASLRAMKSWIDVFLTIAPSQYVGFSACTYAQMARCLIGIWRLSTCEYPEWDRKLVTDNIDVSLVLEQAKSNFSRVKEDAGLTGECLQHQHQDFFTIMASRLGSLKASWDTDIGSTTVSPDTLLSFDLGEYATEVLDTWNWQST